MTIPLRRNILAINALEKIIMGMDDDDGIPEAMYTGIVELLEVILGPSSTTVFTRWAKATDGRYYLPEGEGAEVWDEMMDCVR